MEKRSIKKAVTGIMMALTMVNPVVSHCTVVVPTCISFMMDAIAGVMSVWSSTAMNVPKINTHTISTCFLVSPMGNPRFACTN